MYIIKGFYRIFLDITLMKKYFFLSHLRNNINHVDKLRNLYETKFLFTIYFKGKNYKSAL